MKTLLDVPYIDLSRQISQTTTFANEIMQSGFVVLLKSPYQLVTTNPSFQTKVIGDAQGYTVLALLKLKV